MVTHDEQIGEVLNKLDQLGVADNTIVMYSTDPWPRERHVAGPAATRHSPWGRGLQLGGRLARAVFPYPAGRAGVPAGLGADGGCSPHQDLLFPTLLAIAGEPDVRKKLHDGHTVGSMCTTYQARPCGRPTTSFRA